MSTMNGKKLARRMARTALAACLCLGLGLSGGVAHADGVVRLSTNARLLSRPGERAPSLVNLSKGQTVRVIGQQGRWLKVSARGRVGWVTRTQVELGDDAPVAARAVPQKRPASKGPKARKGWSSMDEDAVGEDAAGDDDEENPLEEAKPRKKARAQKRVAKAQNRKAAEIAPGAKVTVTEEAAVRQRPSAKADELFSAEEGQELEVLVVDEEGEWVRVQDEDGTKGWIEASALEVAEASEAEAEAEADDDADEDEKPRKKKGKKAKKAKGDLWYAGTANVGVLSKSQTYTSMGTTPRANYGVANTSPAIVIGGIAQKRMARTYSIGAEGSYMRTVGGSGIDIEGSMDPMTGEPENLAWAAQALDVRGTLNYDVSKGKYQLVGRVGYHMASVTVDQSTTVMLPSERVSGITVGGGLVAPELSPKAALRVGLDMLMSAKLEQTENMKDGESAAVKAYYLNAIGTYKWKPQMDLMASYTLSYEGFGFSGTNQRDAGATGAQRKDTQHVIAVGVFYKF